MLLGLLLSLALIQTVPATQPGGGGVEIAEATTLLLPATFTPGEEIDLVFHFHGGAQAVAREMERVGVNAVLVAFSPGGRSSAYSGPFQDQEKFARVLETALEHLRRREEIADDAQWGRIYLTSFSAGFGAVREILKHPRYVEQIDGVLMADSLYCGYRGDPAERQVDAALMAPFTAFAEQAAAGEKVLILTHSYIAPPGYAGTHETADFLLARLGLTSQPADEPGPAGLRIDRRARKGGFHVIGCAGDTGDAHVAHLQHIGTWLPLLFAEA